MDSVEASPDWVASDVASVPSSVVAGGVHLGGSRRRQADPAQLVPGLQQRGRRRRRVRVERDRHGRALPARIPARSGRCRCSPCPPGCSRPAGTRSSPRRRDSRSAARDSRDRPRAPRRRTCRTCDCTAPARWRASRSSPTTAGGARRARAARSPAASQPAQRRPAASRARAGVRSPTSTSVEPAGTHRPRVQPRTAAGPTPPRPGRRPACPRPPDDRRTGAAAGTGARPRTAGSPRSPGARPAGRVRRARRVERYAASVRQSASTLQQHGQPGASTDPVTSSRCGSTARPGGRRRAPARRRPARGLRVPVPSSTVAASISARAVCCRVVPPNGTRSRTSTSGLRGLRTATTEAGVQLAHGDAAAGRAGRRRARSRNGPGPGVRCGRSPPRSGRRVGWPTVLGGAGHRAPSGITRSTAQRSGSRAAAAAAMSSADSAESSSGSSLSSSARPCSSSSAPNERVRPRSRRSPGTATPRTGPTRACAPLVGRPVAARWRRSAPSLASMHLLRGHRRRVDRAEHEHVGIARVQGPAEQARAGPDVGRQAGSRRPPPTAAGRTRRRSACPDSTTKARYSAQVGDRVRQPPADGQGRGGGVRVDVLGLEHARRATARRRTGARGAGPPRMSSKCRSTSSIAASTSKSPHTVSTALAGRVVGLEEVGAVLDGGRPAGRRSRHTRCGRWRTR